jgi:hypothetical protein
MEHNSAKRAHGMAQLIFPAIRFCMKPATKCNTNKTKTNTTTQQWSATTVAQIANNQQHQRTTPTTKTTTMTVENTNTENQRKNDAMPHDKQQLPIAANDKDFVTNHSSASR